VRSKFLKYPVMSIFELTGEPLFNPNRTAIVLAKDEEQARHCMTFGSDSCWTRVYTCKKLKTLYQNCGAFILSSK
jgi:hypothetical protein